MSAAKHTPGPWEQSTFKAANGDICIGVKSSAASIAVAWTNGRTEAEAIENARLVSEEAEGHFTIGCIEDAREALAKATGSTP